MTSAVQVPLTPTVTVNSYTFHSGAISWLNNVKRSYPIAYFLLQIKRSSDSDSNYYSVSMSKNLSRIFIASLQAYQGLGLSYTIWGLQPSTSYIVHVTAFDTMNYSSNPGPSSFTTSYGNLLALFSKNPLPLLYFSNGTRPYHFDMHSWLFTRGEFDMEPSY